MVWGEVLRGVGLLSTACCVTHDVSMLALLPCVPLCPAVSPPDLDQTRPSCREGFPLAGTLPLKRFINPSDPNYSSQMQQNVTFVNLEASKAPAGKGSPSFLFYKEPLSSSLPKSFIAHYVAPALGCGGDDLG